MAGGQVFPMSDVVSPILHSEYGSWAKHHSGVFLAKVLTQVQSPKQTHTAHDSLFFVPAHRLPPAGDAVVCLFQEPNTRLPASLERCIIL